MSDTFNTISATAQRDAVGSLFIPTDMLAPEHQKLLLEAQFATPAAPAPVDPFAVPEQLRAAYDQLDPDTVLAHLKARAKAESTRWADRVDWATRNLAYQKALVEYPLPALNSDGTRDYEPPYVAFAREDHEARLAEEIDGEEYLIHLGRLRMAREQLAADETAKQQAEQNRVAVEQRIAQKYTRDVAFLARIYRLMNRYATDPTFATDVDKQIKGIAG